MIYTSISGRDKSVSDDVKILRSEERAGWDPWNLLMTAELERKIRLSTCSFNAVSNVRVM